MIDQEAYNLRKIQDACSEFSMIGCYKIIVSLFSKITLVFRFSSRRDGVPVYVHEVKSPTPGPIECRFRLLSSMLLQLHDRRLCTYHRREDDSRYCGHPLTALPGHPRSVNDLSQHQPSASKHS